ncbi:MAG: trigger factor [Actinobacteria bacterium]|nr:MAG: trigger factor [Actinomycetota bacterium]
MESSCKPLEGVKVEVTVDLSADEVTRAISDAFARLSGRLRIPGFRPGKAPRAIVESRIGTDAVLEEARDQLTEETYPLAVNELDLRPIAPGDFGELKTLVDGEPYTYTVTVEVRPELALSSDDAIVVTVPAAHATDREIDAQLDYLRERHATLEPVERGLQVGDFALISFVGLVDGEEYEGNAVDKYLYESGRGLMPAEFDAAIAGVAAGGSAHAEFPIPDSSSVEEFVGRTATFDIEVHEVKEKALPALDDEFAGTVGGFETLDELRADIRKRMDEAKGVGHLREVERSARHMLGQRLAGEVPESMVEYRANALTQEFFETLEQRQISLDDYVAATGVTPEQIQADIMDRARDVLTEELALEALFRQRGMEVTEQELTEEIARMAGAEEGAAERMSTRLREAGMLPLVRETIMHRLATRWLMDSVEVIEVDPVDEPADEPTADEPAAE